MEKLDYPQTPKLSSGGVKLHPDMSGVTKTKKHTGTFLGSLTSYIYIYLLPEMLKFIKS